MVIIKLGHFRKYVDGPVLKKCTRRCVLKESTTHTVITFLMWWLLYQHQRGCPFSITLYHACWIFVFTLIPVATISIFSVKSNTSENKTCHQSYIIVFTHVIEVLVSIVLRFERNACMKSQKTPSNHWTM